MTEEVQTSGIVTQVSKSNTMEMLENKESQTMTVFISYCQKDESYINEIEAKFKDTDIVFRRDVREISTWKSIRKFMQTIRDTDYAVLLITDNYLKSPNCMYEVLEVMKEQNYEDRIFPVVVENSIYRPEGWIPYIHHWKEKYEDLKKGLEALDTVDLGPLSKELEKIQNIKSSMSGFLALVADKNNSSIQDIKLAIEGKLKEYKQLHNEKRQLQNAAENERVLKQEVSKEAPRERKNLAYNVEQNISRYVADISSYFYGCISAERNENDLGTARRKLNGIQNEIKTLNMEIASIDNLLDLKKKEAQKANLLIDEDNAKRRLDDIKRSREIDKVDRKIAVDCYMYLKMRLEHNEEANELYT